MSIRTRLRLTTSLFIGAALCLVASSGCDASGAAGASAQATPAYNERTGKLEKLTMDRNGDGKVDTTAHMDGVRFKSVELDRNHDGKPDRWEYYDVSAADGGRSVLVRAEEVNGPDGKVSRKEFYDHGRIQRIEEDTDFDGRLDKWCWYADGGLVKEELDIQGKGFPDRRVFYGKTGQVERIEADPDGDGKFVPWKGGGDGDTD